MIFKLKNIASRTLHDHYVVEKLTLQQIGTKYGVTREAVRIRLKKIGVFGLRNRAPENRSVYCDPER